MIKGYFGTSVKMANGKYVESLPFAISRVGTKLYPLSAAEEPDESKEILITRFFTPFRMT